MHVNITAIIVYHLNGNIKCNYILKLNFTKRREPITRPRGFFRGRVIRCYRNVNWKLKVGNKSKLLANLGELLT